MFWTLIAPLIIFYEDSKTKSLETDLKPTYYVTSNGIAFVVSNTTWHTIIY